MNTLVFTGRKALGAAVMLALSLAAFAQEETDNIGPAVDTSAVAAQDVVNEGNGDQIAASEIEPAVDTSSGADDIRRSSSGNRVMDSIALDRTEITGNQELPKVLYILPWQKADPGDLMGKPVNTLLDDVLAPIDREEFLRQVDYYDDLHSEKE